MTQKPEIKTIWFDMDGTLALWNKNGIYNKPQSHYFRHVKPDPFLVPLFWDLHMYAKEKLHIITNICTKDHMEQEYMPDKEIWIKETFPCFVQQIQNQYHPLQNITKASFASAYLNRRLTKQDILISDSNHDVIPWDDTGGLAFKYINGINDPASYHGPKLYRNTDTSLHAFLNKIAVIQTQKEPKE